MTAYPVVAVTPNTRTVRECRYSEMEQWAPDCGTEPVPNSGHERRVRTVPTVTWMVVDQPADLTTPCPDLRWAEAERCGVSRLTCSTCNGTGRVVRVHAAEEQPDDLWTERLEGTQRRQVVRWQATTATLYPVIAEGIYTDAEAADLMRTGFICAGDGDGSLYPAGIKRGERSTRISHEPWAADLRPGQTVLRLDGWQPVNPAITDMVCTKSPPWPDGCGGGCSICDGTAVVPLSVPSGTIIRINF